MQHDKLLAYVLMQEGGIPLVKDWVNTNIHPMISMLNRKEKVFS